VLFKQEVKKATNLLDKKIPFEKQMNLLPYEVRVWEVDVVKQTVHLLPSSNSSYE
jgi:hypothetical protein